MYDTLSEGKENLSKLILLTVKQENTCIALPTTKMRYGL